jgi:catechol 2,3-dioxygenase-like lactoylglutathione lyase family enzyme
MWQKEKKYEKVIKSMRYTAFYISNLKRARDFYNNTLGSTKNYEYSSYGGFACEGIEIGQISKEKVEIGDDVPTVEFTMDDFDHFCETLKREAASTLEPPYDVQWSVRRTGFKDSDGTF